jgi:hypothetical protein
MPSLEITIDVFSGRPNPVIALEGRQAREILDRLTPAEKLGRRDPGPPPDSTLGYRGIVIRQTKDPVRSLPTIFRYVHGSVFGPELAHHAQDPDFEDFVCGSTGLLRPLKLGPHFPELLRKEIDRFKGIRTGIDWRRKIIFPRRPKCRCAPLYEPAWWNDGGQRQWNNNCYNYGANYRSDTFAQPGKAAGAMYGALTCAAVRPAAISDALIDAPGANNKCPAEGHLVALVIAPGWDFHWYRKGRNGYWSHKPGGTAVTNRDNSNHLIADPCTADRGAYTDFCTFMIVMHGHIKIA